MDEMGKMLTDMYNAGGIRRALAEEAVTTGGFHFKRGKFPFGNPDDRSVAINPDGRDLGLGDLKNGKDVPFTVQTPKGPKRIVIPKEVGKEVAPKNSAESALGHELGHSILGLKDYFNKEKLPPEAVDALGKDNIPFIPGSPSGINTLLEQFMREEDGIDPRKSYFLCPLDTQEEFDPDEVGRLRDFLKGYDLQPWLDKLDKISPEPPPKPECGSYDTRKIYEANPGLGPWP